MMKALMCRRDRRGCETRNQPNSIAGWRLDEAVVNPFGCLDAGFSSC